jgi:hypothetical protein
MATLEELQARLTRLDDIKNIENLQKIYGYYQDYGDWEKIVDLFTDDDPSVEEADRGVYRGKARVRRYFVDLIGGGPGKPRRRAGFPLCFSCRESSPSIPTTRRPMVAGTSWAWRPNRSSPCTKAS